MALTDELSIKGCSGRNFHGGIVLLAPSEEFGAEEGLIKYDGAGGAGVDMFI